MATPQDVIKMVKENEVKFVDFRFTDTRGKEQHVTVPVSAFDEDKFENGHAFDGSSIAGWKGIQASDMQLMPDPSYGLHRSFLRRNDAGADLRRRRAGRRQGLRPRPAFDRQARRSLSEVLRHRRYRLLRPGTRILHFRLRRVERRHVGLHPEDLFGGSRLVLRREVRGRQHPATVPASRAATSRCRRSTACRTSVRPWCLALEALGVPVEVHHHEVATAGQCEIGTKFSTLVKRADWTQILKYVVHNVAHQYGKTATFMPKPIVGDNGSGMHVHQSIWKDGKNLFAGNGYAGLSEIALFYIGGIIKHAKALNAITNPGTNSYKRLVPRFEAPVKLAYSAKNRSASIRIPHVASDKARRIETRFPDPIANPYLCFSALLMAGLDGIQNKIHPGDPADKNLYDLPPEEDAKIPTVCASLDEALAALDKDREFLTRGGVFSNDWIDAYIELKMDEVNKVPHDDPPGRVRHVLQLLIAV